MKFSEINWSELFNWKENLLFLLYIILGCRLAVMAYDYPFMLIIFSVSGISYMGWMVYKTHGWEEIGRINYIYSFDEDASKKHFVAYLQNENNENKVLQHIYGSMAENLLRSHVESDPIQAVDVNGSMIEIYSCDPLICHHIKIMAQWCCDWCHHWDENELRLGITKQDWVSNEDKVWRTPCVLLDLDNPDKDIYSRFRNPYENYMIGRSCTWEVDLKIQNKIYNDVNICVHIFEDPAIALYENFWMYGVFCDVKLVDNKNISIGDDVSVRYKKRKKNLLTY